MGKTSGDTSVAGKLKDASEFARCAIEQGVAFVPGAPLLRLMRIWRRCGAGLLRRMWGEFWRGWGGWGKLCNRVLNVASSVVEYALNIRLEHGIDVRSRFKDKISLYFLVPKSALY